MSVEGQLRWGILGVAKINERIIPAMRKSKLTHLRAIASRSSEKSRLAAAEFEIAQHYSDYESLLSDPEIDAVYIPLPNHLHAEWTRKAADAGKHVLCEKPLAPTAAEARELVDHCKAKGVKLMDGFMWVHHPRTQRTRRFIDDGGIGQVQRVNGCFSFILEPLSRENIRLHRAWGGGGLLDVGCYPVYGIRWAFGEEPVRVSATARFLHDVDVDMCGTLYFADGRTASFDCGFTLPFRGWMEIVGTQGTIFMPEMWLPPYRAVELITHETRGAGELVDEGHDQIVCMFNNFATAVFENREPMPDIEEAVKTLKVLDALDRSARQGGVIVEVAG